MSHLPDLISDLALILISAGIITLLFKWLKQPLVLGYIVAGLLAGPYVQIFPTVVDVENINLWAEWESSSCCLPWDLSLVSKS